MRKLKLTVENLRVETFDPDAAPGAEAGTVQAKQNTGYPMSCYPECSGDTYCWEGPCSTQGATCSNSCREPQYMSQCGGLSCYEGIC